MAETTTSSITPSEKSDLGGLAKMSRTAGLGNDEYAAVSPLSIAALLLGLIGFVAIFTEWLLVLPAAAIVCGILGIRQVRRSEGTLTWGPAAWTGIGLGLVTIALVVGGRVLNEVRIRPDRTAMLGVLDQFNRAIETGDLEAAYALVSPKLKARVSFVEFEANIRVYDRTARGRLTALESNGVILFINPDGSIGAGAGTRLAILGVIPKFKNVTETSSQEIWMQKNDQDKWEFTELFMFPRPKQ